MNSTKSTLSRALDLVTMGSVFRGFIVMVSLVVVLVGAPAYATNTTPTTPVIPVIPVTPVIPATPATTATTATTAAPTASGELKSIAMCAFVLLGETGPDFQAMVDYQAAALNWGAKVEIKPYMSESIVVEEFKAGECDIALISSFQARRFNTFAATLDAIGTMPTYDHLKMALSTLAKPSAEKYLRKDDYEVIGVQPLGSVFIFSNDGDIKSLADLAGKRMTILDTMTEMRELIVKLGMTPVSSTLTNIYQKFNNRAVDLTGGPALVYEMMELHKGLEPNGGIVDRPLIQTLFQMVARWEKLPAGFGQKSREYFVQNFDKSLKMIKDAEQNIPKKWWISYDDEEEYLSTTRSIRYALRDKGFYDPKMLSLLRRIRCKIQPVLAECTDKNAE